MASTNFTKGHHFDYHKIPARGFKKKRDKRNLQEKGLHGGVVYAYS